MIFWESLGIEHVNIVDFEFGTPVGGHPEVRCLVVKNYLTCVTRRYWIDELSFMKTAPYQTGQDAVVIAYYASAEIGCHLALGWPVPSKVLDLYPEFRNHTNGYILNRGAGLLGALSFFGIDCLSAIEKESMRELALRGGDYTEREKIDLLDYCESDVMACEKLLLAMSDVIDLPRALLRGRYMKAVAAIETNGIPLDVNALSLLRENWASIKERLVEVIDKDFGIYEGITFKQAHFASYLAKMGIPWPRTDKGALKLDDDTFRDMGKSHPEINRLRELRNYLSQMKLNALAVGSDGRNRCLLSAFSARTGRNQPSSKAFIFRRPDLRLDKSASFQLHNIMISPGKITIPPLFVGISLRPCPDSPMRLEIGRGVTNGASFDAFFSWWRNAHFRCTGF